MKSKPFLIAIAAFAVTASGVQAYGGTELLERAGLSEKQIGAFETAREKRQAGDIVGARDVLIEAGIDEEVLHSVHAASHEMRVAMGQALEDEDFAAFIEAVEDTPLAVVDTEEEFKLFIEAESLRKAGKPEEAKAILDELGIEAPTHHGRFGHRMGGFHMGRDELTDAQREALRVAHQANDKDAEEAILEEAGIELRGHMMGHR